MAMAKIARLSHISVKNMYFSFYMNINKEVFFNIVYCLKSITLCVLSLFVNSKICIELFYETFL